MSATFTRTALARQAGVSADTLRHYERKGVLPRPPRSANGYRRYPPEALARVQLIRRALTIGFRLDELARVLKERDAGGAPCRKVRAVVASRLADLEQRLVQLTTLRDDLHALLADWDAKLEGLPTGRQARLLDGLVSGSQVRLATSSRKSASIVDCCGRRQ
jgi:DNA-binding transcriptional MerR regulator